MNRTVGIMLLFSISLVHVTGTMLTVSISQNQYTLADEEGPSIDWMVDDEFQNITIAWDGAYTGQTEENWDFWIWVNDTDGVDTVIFMFMWIGRTEWKNVTGVLVEGNSTKGLYNGNFTYAVWWNYTLGRPQTEGSGGNFHFKLFANDTLGNRNTSPVLTYMGGYMLVNPPIYFYLASPTGIALIGALVAFAVTFAVWFRRRHQ
ncbi:MAG: hypothetical protein ACFFEF_18030 [Candidatus Thorarchaeota archaeon]